MRCAPGPEIEINCAFFFFLYIYLDTIFHEVLSKCITNKRLTSYLLAYLVKTPLNSLAAAIACGLVPTNLTDLIP